MAQRIQVRRGTAAAATAANPTLSAGEIGYETDTNKFKFGDGTTAWNSLPYGGAAADLAAHLADTTDAHDASAISVVPTGGVAATDVQAALAELDTEKGLATLPAVFLSRWSVYSLPNGTITAIPWLTASWDTDAFWNSTTNPSRVTVPTGLGGLYLLNGTAQHKAPTGMIQCRFHLNGALIPNGISAYASTSGWPTVSHSAAVRLVPGDYVELFAYQSSGAAADLNPDASSFGATRLGN